MSKLACMRACVCGCGVDLINVGQHGGVVVVLIQPVLASTVV